MAEVKEITDRDWDKAVMEAETPVIVDFYATWCGPCRQISPLLESIADEHPELAVVKLDIDANRETAQRYSVMSVPTLMTFVNGEVKNTVVGAKPKTVLERNLLSGV